MQVAKAQAPSTQAKPNILFILVDNLGYGELGVYTLRSSFPFVSPAVSGPALAAAFARRGAVWRDKKIALSRLNQYRR